jgi:myb proto-oncogene protein
LIELGLIDMDMDMDMDMDRGYYMAGMGMAAASAMSPAGSSAVTAVATASEDEGGLRRGPWTAHEDMLLVDYITKHGEGRWNSLARCAGIYLILWNYISTASS